VEGLTEAELAEWTAHIEAEAAARGWERVCPGSDCQICRGFGRIPLDQKFWSPCVGSDLSHCLAGAEVKRREEHCDVCNDAGIYETPGGWELCNCAHAARKIEERPDILQLLKKLGGNASSFTM